MVRFARAKGSKASNEKRFEEASSWSEMKQQLVDAQRRAQSKTSEIIREVGVVNDNQNEPIETSWAHFDVPCYKTRVKRFPDTERDEQIKRKGEKQILYSSDQHIQLPDDGDTSNGHNYGSMRKEKKKRNKLNSVATNEENIAEKNEAMSKQKFQKKVNEKSMRSEEETNFHSKQVRDTYMLSDKAIKGKKRKPTIVGSEESLLSKGLTTTGDKDEAVSQRKKKRKKDKFDLELKNKENATEEEYELRKSDDEDGVRQKKRRRHKVDLELTVENAIVDEYDKSTERKKVKKKRERHEIQINSEDSSSWQQTGLESNYSKSHEEVENNKIKDKKELVCNNNIIGNQKLTKLQKEKSGFPISRRNEPIATAHNRGSCILETCLFDGYAVLKEDWERLDKMKKKMLEEGVPENERRARLKQLRRQAEKFLARKKNIVCLRCRKRGHLLADCPINNDDLIESAGSNICFKCGSTEHSYSACKVVKTESFRYASCFVCGEQGHISRQCPDNPRGVYPTGGACKVCGDVTHLKKDCPQYQEIQHQSTVTLQTLSSNIALEALETDTNKDRPLLPQKSKKKIVKF